MESIPRLEGDTVDHIEAHIEAHQELAQRLSMVEELVATHETFGREIERLRDDVRRIYGLLTDAEGHRHV